jgi:hypothetical protein
MSNPFIDVDGTQIYYKNNKRHRIGGPAYISPDGIEMYFEDGRRHRIGGPAIIRADGYEQYWIMGKRVTELEHDLLFVIMKLKSLTE